VQADVTASIAPQASTSLGRYTLIASLGEGGMARVYLALMAGPGDFNKLLVVKTLHESMTTSHEFVQMFLDEARLAARLHHPNIVQTNEVGEHDGRFFMAMEYLEGQSLRTVQRRLSGLPLPHELRVISETARGLHYVHDLSGYGGEPLNVVHRDVSPQNVFITYGGQVKLLDFGIAKTAEHEHRTKVGVIKGKLEYIAPEQIRGEKLDRRADVFALGVMLYEAAAGRRFAAPTADARASDVARIHARLIGSEPRLRDVRPDVPEELARIVDRAIALSPDERYPTARALADDIDAYLEASGEKPNARGLAELINEPFKVEREKVGALIEKQVRLSKASGGLNLARLATINDPGTPSEGTQLPSIDLTASGSIAIQEENTPVTDHGARVPLAAALVTGKHVPKPSRTKLVAAVVVFVGIVGVGLWTAQRPEQTDTEARAALPAPVAPVEPPKPAAAPSVATTKPTAETIPATFRIRIEVEPASAEVTLDGSTLQMPFSAELARDGKLHYVEARAEGFEMQRFSMPFDRDRELKIVLKEEPRERGKRSSRRRNETPPVADGAPAAPAPPVEAPAAQPQDPYNEESVPKQRIRRNIDTDDPWAQ
jgi:serine/threonine protein kinase